ncbi:MAG TPA: hypothetical protein VIG84_03400 [Brevundimonas sp.]
MKPAAFAAFAVFAALALSALPGAAAAMSVQEFLTSANRIPRNPTALLRSDTRRLMNEISGAFQAVRNDQAAARTAGRRPATCIPDGKISLSAEQILDRFNAIPAQRRHISVDQAVREWMAERYPCPT